MMVVGGAPEVSKSQLAAKINFPNMENQNGWFSFQKTILAAFLELDCYMWKHTPLSNYFLAIKEAAYTVSLMLVIQRTFFTHSVGKT